MEVWGEGEVGEMVRKFCSRECTCTYNGTSLSFELGQCPDQKVSVHVLPQSIYIRTYMCIPVGQMELHCLVQVSHWSALLPVHSSFMSGEVDGKVYSQVVCIHNYKKKDCPTYSYILTVAVLL